MNILTPGKLLVIDGPDGAGKTTACKFIQAQMQAMDKPFKEVNILSGNRTSCSLRVLLLDQDTDLHPKAEMLAFAAAIINTMEKEVKPLLAEGINVLIDRGPFSNFAYQIQDLGNPNFALWASIHSGFKPDATLLLSTDAQVGLDRCLQRDGALDRMEAKGLKFHTVVQQSFKMIQGLIPCPTPEDKSVFRAMAGKATIYTNNGTLEELRNICTNFVGNTFYNPAVLSKELAPA